MQSSIFDQNNMSSTNNDLTLEALRVTEAAAIAAAEWIGRGNEKAADQAAVDAMRNALNQIDIDGLIVIGEGERDKAPMLYIGEKVGTKNGPAVDIALDPLEGTTICATAGPGSLAIIAMAERGGFLQAPDVYMEKIAIGAGFPDSIIDLDNSPAQNIKNLAQVKGVDPSEIMVCILERKRHEDIIRQVRETGARIQLIPDGDVAAIIATSIPGSRIDMYIGTGGAPEGVLAAASLATIGGQMMGRLIYNSEQEKARALGMGINDLSKKYLLQDLAHGNIIFAATGVTTGSLVPGVQIYDSGVTTTSIVMRSSTSTIRNVETHYLF